jgi:hypothetical protein
MKKRIAVLILLSLMITTFFGCGEKNEPKTSSGSQVETSSQPEVAKAKSPFTGETVEDETALLNRPVAVMVNNIKVSLPQKGIGDADIIYELPVEGAITRLMAVFSDYNKVKDVGSIRSARHDYVELIAPYQPIYVHVGGSVKGKQAIKDYKIDDIDGIFMSGTAFYQDKERLKTKAVEHTWFTNLDRLNKGIAQKGYKIKLEKPIDPLFQFANVNEDVMQQKAEAVNTNKVNFQFSSTTKAAFTYNAQTKQYEKWQFGEPHIDANTNKVVSVSNVLMMYTDVGLVPNTINKEINLSKGTGYYLSHGKRIEVTFSKADVYENLKVFDKNGNELKMNVGKTWVCIIPQQYKQNVSFE